MSKNNKNVQITEGHMTKLQIQSMFDDSVSVPQMFNHTASNNGAYQQPHPLTTTYTNAPPSIPTNNSTNIVQTQHNEHKNISDNMESTRFKEVKLNKVGATHNAGTDPVISFEINGSKSLYFGFRQNVLNERARIIKQNSINGGAGYMVKRDLQREFEKMVECGLNKERDDRLKKKDDIQKSSGNVVMEMD